MGFHVCEYCKKDRKNKHYNTSSGDVTLHFDSGRSYVMPDMILHYIVDHGWVPPKSFVDDVVNNKVVESGRVQMRGGGGPTPVGYLKGPFETGSVPRGFVEKLEILMAAAEQNGYRMQTKSLLE
ncbi:MAG: hypothetical protein WC788_09240 [Candidatus Paceibacterota bacterium]